MIKNYGSILRNIKELFISIIIHVLLIVLSAFLISALIWYITDNPYYHNLDEYSSESDEFRLMNFSEEGLSNIYKFSEENDLDPYMVMAVFMLNNDFIPEDMNKELSLYDYESSKKAIEKYRKTELRKLANAYKTLLSDLVYFPLPKGDSEHSENFYYGNSWGGERTYGGDRTHEGTDIMDGGNERGFFPIVSISDGTVENVGWLEQGGYRIGIRTKSGAYIYYAHLHSYAENICEGYKVKAGELIGFMGDTGYSAVEGTTGNFDVHLHLGLYFKTDHYEELSVNPYYILKYLENKKLKYSY